MVEPVVADDVAAGFGVSGSKEHRVVGVVVAAGMGVRLNAGRPKALVEVAGHPLVWWATKSLGEVANRIIVTVPKGFEDEFASALANFDATLVVGGATRQESVARAISQLDSDGHTFVLIHDAARPFMPVSVTKRVLAKLVGGSVAVAPVVDVVDSIRKLAHPIDGIASDSVSVDRTHLRAVQTPQGFRLAELADAHQRLAESHHSDDVTLCELAGYRVDLVEGDSAGFKVTEPQDIEIASLRHDWSN